MRLRKATAPGEGGAAFEGIRPDHLHVFGDGRAKLVRLTTAGRKAIGEGRRLIGEIEADWGDAIGSMRFADLCESMQQLLDELQPSVREGYRPGA